MADKKVQIEINAKDNASKEISKSRTELEKYADSFKFTRKAFIDTSAEMELYKKHLIDTGVSVSVAAKELKEYSDQLRKTQLTLAKQDAIKQWNDGLKKQGIFANKSSEAYEKLSSELNSLEKKYDKSKTSVQQFKVELQQEINANKKAAEAAKAHAAEIKKQGQAAEKAEQKQKKFLRSLVGIGGFLRGALGIAAVVRFTKALLGISGAASRVERETIKLSTAMKSAGRYTDESFEALKRHAVQVERTTGTTREKVLKIQTILQTFGKMSEENIKKSTLQAINMATIFNESVEQSAIRIGKASVGYLTALRRVGVDVKRTKFEVEGFSHVLKQLNTEFGGQASARLKGFAGLITKISIGVSQASVALGDLINANETLSNWFQGVGAFFNWFTDALSKESKAVEATAKNIIKTTKDVREMQKALQTLGLNTELVDLQVKLKDIEEELKKVRKGSVELAKPTSKFLDQQSKTLGEILKKSRYTLVTDNRSLDLAKEKVEIEKRISQILDDKTQKQSGLDALAEKEKRDKEEAEKNSKRQEALAAKEREEARKRELAAEVEAQSKQRAAFEAETKRRLQVWKKRRERGEELAKEEEARINRKTQLLEDQAQRNIELIRQEEEELGIFYETDIELAKKAAQQKADIEKSIFDFKINLAIKAQEDKIKLQQDELNTLKTFKQQEEEAYRDELRKTLLDERTSFIERALIYDDTQKKVDDLYKKIAAVKSPIELGKVIEEYKELQKILKDTEGAELFGEEIGAGLKAAKEKMSSFKVEDFEKKLFDAEQMKLEMSKAGVSAAQATVIEMQKVFNQANFTFKAPKPDPISKKNWQPDEQT